MFLIKHRFFYGRIQCWSNSRLSLFLPIPVGATNILYMHPVYIFLPYIECIKSKAHFFSLDAPTHCLCQTWVAFLQWPVTWAYTTLLWMYFPKSPEQCPYTKFLFSFCGSMLVVKKYHISQFVASPFCYNNLLGRRQEFPIHDHFC